MRLMVVVSILWLLPHLSYAAVYINEVAWMGTDTSANDEWIELHNDGSGAVSLADWQLTDSAGLEVVLEGAGSIAPGAHAVLERTDDSSAPGSAFYIYTGSLANTGATLRLYDSAGTLVDQVAGGEGWENIGGDNTTKETAQYTTSGWVTATATPGTANVEGETTTRNADTKTSTETSTQKRSSSGGSGRAARRITKPSAEDAALALTIDAPDIAYVAEPLTLSATITGTGRTGRQTKWNFGDTTIATGAEVTHSYQYPGTYILVATVSYQGETAIAEHELTVVPLTLALTRNRDGAVQLSNTAPYDVALAGVTLTAAAKTYTFPDHTYLKANNAITLPPSVFAVGEEAVVSARDQQDKVVAYHIPAAVRSLARAPSIQSLVTPTPPTHTAATALPPARAAAAAPTPPTTTHSSFTFVSDPTPRLSATNTNRLATTESFGTQTAAVIEAIPQTQTAATSRPGTPYAYLGLIGLLLIAVLALLSRRVG